RPTRSTTGVRTCALPIFLFTLPSAEPATAGGWAFALAPTPAQLARATLDHAAGRVVLSSTVVVSDESVTAITERAALVAELARRDRKSTRLNSSHEWISY